MHRMSARGIMAAACALALAGCGFYLRGSRPMELSLAEVFVQSQAADQLAAEVKRQLGYSDVRLAREAGAADAVVTLSNERFDSRVLSVDPRTGKVRELQLGYAVDLRVTERDGRPLIGPETMSLLRDLVYDETAVISTFEQENLLYKEMKQDAAETVLLRLQTVKLK